MTRTERHRAGPPGVLSMPGGKCSWMIKLAVRVENALPPDDSKAAVPALDTAASRAGTVAFSRP